jgi:hypothetical protein
MRNAKFKNKKYSLADFFYFLLRHLISLIVVFCLGFSFGMLAKETTSYSIYSASGDLEVTSQTVDQKTIQEASSGLCKVLKTTDFLQNSSQKLAAEGIHHSDNTNFTWEELFDGTDAVAQNLESGNCFLVLSFQSKDKTEPIQITNALVSYAPLYLSGYYSNLIFTVSNNASSVNTTKIVDEKLPFAISLVTLAVGVICFVLLDLKSDLIFDADDLESYGKKVFKKKNLGSFFGDCDGTNLPDFKGATLYLISFSSKEVTNAFLVSFKKKFNKNIILVDNHSPFSSQGNVVLLTLFERGFSTFGDLEKMESFSAISDFCFFLCEISPLNFLDPVGTWIRRNRQKNNHENDINK